MGFFTHNFWCRINLLFEMERPIFRKKCLDRVRRDLTKSSTLWAIISVFTQNTRHNVDQTSFRMNTTNQTWTISRQTKFWDIQFNKGIRIVNQLIYVLCVSCFFLKIRKNDRLWYTSWTILFQYNLCRSGQHEIS